MKRLFPLLLITSLFLSYSSCIKSTVPDEELDPNELIETPVLEDIEPAKPIVLTTKQSEKVNIDNLFAFKIFKEVSISPNTFFSPLSLTMALGMLYNGATGDTRTEMAQALGMGDFTETEVNEYYLQMREALLKIDPLTNICIANSIWYRNGFPVKQSFIDINQKYFDAMVKALDFSSPDAADIINKWCAEKTKNKITEIVKKPINDLTMMFLINALYFKSKWQLPFDKAKTKQDDFTIKENQKKKVNMMEQTTTLPYYADKYMQCVEMPYGNDAFSMVTILPDNSVSIEKLIDYLDNTVWKNVLDQMYPQKVWLKLPRFKIECEIPLNDPVKKVGMKQIFDPNVAGLINIADISDLHVSNIKQKTFVEVNEEGTEAAAVTVIEIGITSVGPSLDPKQFFANRPFLYLIKEKSTGAILFIGRMDEPKE